MGLLLFAAVALLMGAVLALVLPGNTLKGWAAISSQAVASGLTLSAVLPVLFGAPALTDVWMLALPLDVVSVRVDALSAFFLAWSLPMTMLGTVYATGYLRPWFALGRNGAPHFALLNTVSLSFLIIYTAQNVLIFLLGWELAAVAAWLLVIWDYRVQRVRFAGFNYLVSTHVGLLVLVATLMYLHGQTDSMDLTAFGPLLSKPGSGRSLVFGLVGLAVALKSALVPVHTWLPRAHAAAPAHVSALMSGVIHKAGLFLLLRFVLLMGVPDEWMGWAVVAVGTTSAVYGVVYTTTERDLKRLLGYSSTENVGVIGIGLGLAMLGLSWHNTTLVALGLFAGTLHVLNHALFKCLLFYAAGAVYSAAHTVDVERLGGLLKRMPTTGALFALGALALAGLPPLNGFVSEFILFAGLLQNIAPTPASNAALVCVAATLALVGALSALAMVRAFGLTFLGAQRDPAVHLREPPEAPTSMLAPMLGCAAAIVGVAVMPCAVARGAGPLLAQFGVPLEALDMIVDLLVPVQSASRFLLGLLGLVAGLAYARGGGARVGVTWGCGYRLPSPRMQYTAGSFSQQIGTVFATFLGEQSRVRLSRRVLPTRSGLFELTFVDAVERRMFEVLRRGEHFFVRAAAVVPEEPRFAFAAGLVVLLAMATWVLSGVAPPGPPGTPP